MALTEAEAKKQILKDQQKAIAAVLVAGIIYAVRVGCNQGDMSIDEAMQHGRQFADRVEEEGLLE